MQRRNVVANGAPALPVKEEQQSKAAPACRHFTLSNVKRRRPRRRQPPCAALVPRLVRWPSHRLDSGSLDTRPAVESRHESGAGRLARSTRDQRSSLGTRAAQGGCRRRGLRRVSRLVSASSCTGDAPGATLEDKAWMPPPTGWFTGDSDAAAAVEAWVFFARGGSREGSPAVFYLILFGL